MVLTQGGQLRLVDPKKQATAELLTADELAERHPEIARLGLDAVDEPIAWTDFAGRLVRREGKLKSVAPTEQEMKAYFDAQKANLGSRPATISWIFDSHRPNTLSVRLRMACRRPQRLRM